jgi:NTE family protein
VPISVQSVHQAIDAIRTAGAPDKRALVLAGAGAAGNAWELGLVAGLADAGVDLTDADLIVGTSAGSTVAAQITSGTPPKDLYAAILSEPRPQTGATASSRGRPAPSSGPGYMEWSNAIIASAADAADMRRRMGAAALERNASDGPGSGRWRDIVAARLPSSRWPEQPLLIAAVDAQTGEPVVFDRHSGIDLVDAVAASTSNGFGGPYEVGGNRYINGGYRRNENADLAAGSGRVLVLSPFGGKSRHPLEWRMDLASQVDELRANGSRVETIFPDSDSEHLFGANAMDLSLRPPAARAGYAQGEALAGRLTEFWDLDRS